MPCKTCKHWQRNKGYSPSDEINAKMCTEIEKEVFSTVAPFESYYTLPDFECLHYETRGIRIRRRKLTG